MNGVAVAVPMDWGLNETHCGTPVKDTFVFEPSRFGTRACAVPQTVSSLHAAPMEFSPAGELAAEAESAGDISGAPVSRVPAERWRGCGGDAAQPCLFRGALVALSKDVVFWVVSPKKLVIDEILDSAELIPRGYTAVPDVSGLIGDSDPLVRLVEKAGLSWNRSCPDGSICYMDNVTATAPGAGSVVPVGTTVRAVERPQKNALVKLPSVTGWAESEAVRALRTVVLPLR